MTSFHVPEVHCEGCVRSITRAVQGIDPAAVVRVDLATKRVAIESVAAAAGLAAAIEDAGFSAEPMPG